MKSEMFITEAKVLAKALNQAILPIALCGLFNCGFWRLYHEAYWLASEYTDWFCDVMADWHLYSAMFCLAFIAGILILNVYVKLVPSNEEIVIVRKN